MNRICCNFEHQAPNNCVMNLEMFKKCKDKLSLKKPESAWEMFRRLRYYEGSRTFGDAIKKYIQSTSENYDTITVIFLCKYDEKEAIEIMKKIEKELNNG